jgi:hypothetical protein
VAAHHLIGHPLIEQHLAVLRRALPTDLVDELADGLHSSYHDQLVATGDPDAAARAAVAGFGDPGTIIAAYADTAPARRTARLLLACGPLTGAAWAAALLTAPTWVTQAALPVRLLLGATVAVLAALLASSATGILGYRVRHLCVTAAGVGTLVLDSTMIAVALLTGPTAHPVLLLALAVSGARALLTIRQLALLRRAIT